MAENISFVSPDCGSRYHSGLAFVKLIIQIAKKHMLDSLPGVYSAYVSIEDDNMRDVRIKNLRLVVVGAVLIQLCLGDISTLAEPSVVEKLIKNRG